MAMRRGLVLAVQDDTRITSASGHVLNTGIGVANARVLVSGSFSQPQ